MTARGSLVRLRASDAVGLQIVVFSVFATSLHARDSLTLPEINPR